MTFRKNLDIVTILGTDMRFFDFEKMYIAAHADPRKILEYFGSPRYIGKNFIVNPKALVDAFWVTDQHKAEYLGICALRSYEDYATHGVVDIRIDDLPPWISLDVIKDNPLVTITDKMIILDKEKI